MALGAYQGNGVFAASYMAVGYWFAVALLAMAEKENEQLVWQSYRHNRSRLAETCKS
jgi:hypothetical protein